MRLHAYVLAADPNYLAASLRSYYDVVDVVVVSYDRGGQSWTGTPLPVDDCLTAVKEVDVDGKCVYAPGDYWRPGNGPPSTTRRSSGRSLWTRLRRGPTGSSSSTPTRCSRTRASSPLRSAHADVAGAAALDYPSRWLYARVGDAREHGCGRYLELATAVGREIASYPGPLAVKAGTQLSLARQAAGLPHYRVDLRPWSTDPLRRFDAPVHEVVPVEAAVLHYSWVRTDAFMRRKFGWSGHAEQYSKPHVYAGWSRRSAHPRLAVATNLLRRREERFRLVTLPDNGGPSRD